MHLATTPGWQFLKHELPKLPLEKFDLYVTIVTNLTWTPSDIAAMQNDIYIVFGKCPNIIIELMPNCDVDVGGFFTSLHSILLSGRPYKYVYRTHSKSVTSWMRGLNMPLIDGFEQCEHLFQDPTVGMICASAWLLKSPDAADYGYFPVVQQWMDDLGYPKWEDQSYGFSGGAIFMARLSIFQNWVILMGGVDCLTRRRSVIHRALAGVQSNSIESCPSWLFAIERWYGILVTRSGYSIRGIMYSDHIENDIEKIPNVYVNKPLIVAPGVIRVDHIETKCEAARAQHWNFDVVPYLILNKDVAYESSIHEHESILLAATKHWVLRGQYNM